MFIYLIINDAAKKYYVGQHKGDNLQHYFQQKWYEAAHHLSKRSHLYAAMRKYPDRSKWRIHPLVSTLTTKAQLDKWETYFISLFRSRDPEYGYNICRGGEGFTGPQSESARRKISEKMKVIMIGNKNCAGRVLTTNHKAKLNKTGFTFSPESIEKMRISHLGQSRSMTEKHKRRIGEANAKTWTPERRVLQAKLLKERLSKSN